MLIMRKLIMKTNKRKVELKLRMMMNKMKMQAILRWMLRQMMQVSYRIKTARTMITRTLKKFNWTKLKSKMPMMINMVMKKMRKK